MLQMQNCKRERTLFELAQEGKIRTGDLFPFRSKKGGFTLIYESLSGEEDVQGFFVDEKVNKMQWVVLNPCAIVGGKKAVKITTKEPIGKLYLSGKNAYLNGHKAILKVCKTLGVNESAIVVKSMTISDINQLMGVNVDKKQQKVTQKQDPGKDINICANFLQEVGEEKFMKFFEEIGVKREDAISNAYGYSINELEVPDEFKAIVKTKEPYWLDCNGIAKFEEKVGVGLGCAFKGIVQNEINMYFANGDSKVVGCGIRPVVYVNAELTMEEINSFNNKF